MSILQADIVIVGAGAAGSVIAGRLASADPNLMILVLERGPSVVNDPFVVRPGTYLANLLPSSTRTLFYVGEPSDHIAGRAALVPAGGCVGGGSSINFMMYTRGSPSDYDDWETKYGNPGWGFADLKPLFNKTETYQVDNKDPNHGHTGPLKVSYGGHFSAFAQEWLETVKVYDTSRSVVPDGQNFATSNAYCRWAKWIDGKTGRRQDAATGFVYPHLENENLVVLSNSLVDKVVFEGNRAVGVEFIGKDERRYTARASKLVVLSGGPLASSQVLERSGIGSAKVLRQVGVKPLVDLPGVGEEYQDHNLIAMPYIAAEDKDQCVEFMRGNPEVASAWEKTWYENGSGMMSSNNIDAGGKLRPSPKELKALGEDFNKVWDFFEKGNDKPVVFLGIYGGILTAGPVPDGAYFTAAGYTQHPFSRGSVHIRSQDPAQPPKFDPGFLTHPADLQPLVWQYKHSRELARRLPSYRGEFAPGHPVFPEGSQVACSTRDGPPDLSKTLDLVYSVDDNKAIEEWVRNTVATTWHSLGTCAMKPRDQGGVVDSRLNVYGVEGLKVADLSICPGNVAANTYSTALVVGEKAAVIIGEELGISGV